MSEVHFVFEKPQKHDRPEKKRSRLVTSCDACRSRKIKCRPSGFGDDVCEACKIASSNCVYEERDRIRAERGIANFTVAPANAIQAPTKTLAAKRVARGSAKSSSRSVSRPPLPVRRPSEDERTTDSDSTKSQSPPVRDHNNIIPFFDHRRPDYPHPNLLPHLVSLFFPYVGDRFPWLDPKDTLRSAVAGTLNPAIANCIAAFTARFSDRLPRSAGHRCFAGEPYVEMAKSLLATAMDPPSLDTLQGLIMVAYLESGTPRQESFFAYTDAACIMAEDLKILYEDIIRLAENEHLKVVMRMTFWSVAWLDLYACPSRGKPTVFLIETTTTGVPFSNTHDGSSHMVHVYRSLKQLYIVMSVLKDIAIGAAPNRRASPIRELGLKEMRRFLANFQAHLPADLAFTRDGLLRAEANNNLQYFVLMHQLIHTLIIVVHCPALFWIAQSDDAVVDAPQVSEAWSSARFVVDMFLTVNALDPRLLVGTPCFLFPLSIARAAFSLEQAYAGVPWSTFGGSTNGAYTVQSDCQEYIAKFEDLKNSISVYWATSHEAIVVTPAASIVESREPSPPILHSRSMSIGALGEFPVNSNIGSGAFQIASQPVQTTQSGDYAFIQSPPLEPELWLPMPLYHPGVTPYAHHAHAHSQDWEDESCNDRAQGRRRTGSGSRQITSAPTSYQCV